MHIADTDNFIASLGFEAYRVGGSVRDEIIGRDPKDADYMIRGVDLTGLLAALLFELRGTAKITDLVLRGGQHVGYRIGKPYAVEITLPRREESTGPGHGDFEIVVDPSITLEEDAKRRDFTFNALYKIVTHPDNLTTTVALPNGDLVEGVLDPTGKGLSDLHRRIINVTHGHSFRDDPLRILRALRFVARGYDLGNLTRYLMEYDARAITGLTTPRRIEDVQKWCKCAPGCGHERTTVRGGGMSGTVYQEMSNILMGTEVGKALRIARDVGVLGTLFPELAEMFGHDANSNYHDLTTDEHTFRALEKAAAMDASLEIRWSLLFHDSGKPEVEWKDGYGRSRYYASDANDNVSHEEAGERRWRRAAERMGTSRETREYVAKMIFNHMVSLDGKRRASKVRRLRVEFGDRLLHDLICHRACDIAGKNKSSAAPLDYLLWMENVRIEAERAGVPAKIGDLQVNGHDAIQMGLKGQAIGQALQAVLVDVAAQPNEQTLSREWQAEAVRRWAA